MPPAVIAIAGLALTAAGTIQQRNAQKKASRASARASQAQQRQSTLETQRERRRQIREGRVRRAAAVNAAAAQGAGDSTVVAGVTAGITSRVSTNLGFLSQSSANTAAINRAGREESAAIGDAATGQGLAALGGTIFSNSTQLARIPETARTIFKT